MNKGILESNEAEAELKRIMIKQADKVMLLVDNSKFDKTSFVVNKRRVKTRNKMVN